MERKIYFFLVCKKYNYLLHISVFYIAELRNIMKKLIFWGTIFALFVLGGGGAGAYIHHTNAVQHENTQKWAKFVEIIFLIKGELRIQ